MDHDTECHQVDSENTKKHFGEENKTNSSNKWRAKDQENEEEGEINTSYHVMYVQV